MNRSTLRELLAALTGQRVLVVGDVMLDEYVWGEVRRVSPEAPVPVVEVRSRTYLPGGAGNVAANVAGLGGIAVLGGVIGRDRQGALLAEALRAKGVDTGGVSRAEGRRTTTKTRVMAQGQQVVRLDHEETTPLPPAVEDELLVWVEQQVGTVGAGVLSDYGKGVVSERVARHVIAAGRRAGVPVIVDPKGTCYARYRGATIVKPNLGEAEHLVGQPFRGAAGVREAGERLAEVLPGTVVLLTRGAEGMTLFQPGQPPVDIATAARSVYDVTGAGDTVAGTLVLALAAKVDLESAVRLANLAAGVAVGRVGTATLSARDLLGEASRPIRPRAARRWEACPS